MFWPEKSLDLYWGFQGRNHPHFFFFYINWHTDYYLPWTVTHQWLKNRNSCSGVLADYSKKTHLYPSSISTPQYSHSKSKMCATIKYRPNAYKNDLSWVRQALGFSALIFQNISNFCSLIQFEMYRNHFGKMNKPWDDYKLQNMAFLLSPLQPVSSRRAGTVSALFTMYLVWSRHQINISHLK